MATKKQHAQKQDPPREFKTPKPASKVPGDLAEPSCESASTVVGQQQQLADVLPAELELRSVRDERRAAVKWLMAKPTDNIYLYDDTQSQMLRLFENPIFRALKRARDQRKYELIDKENSQLSADSSKLRKWTIGSRRRTRTNDMLKEHVSEFTSHRQETGIWSKERQDAAAQDDQARRPSMAFDPMDFSTVSPGWDPVYLSYRFKSELGSGRYGAVFHCEKIRELMREDALAFGHAPADCQDYGQLFHTGSLHKHAIVHDDAHRTPLNEQTSVPDDERKKRKHRAHRLMQHLSVCPEEIAVKVFHPGRYEGQELRSGPGQWCQQMVRTDKIARIRRACSDYLTELWNISQINPDTATEHDNPRNTIGKDNIIKMFFTYPDTPSIGNERFYVFMEYMSNGTLHDNLLYPNSPSKWNMFVSRQVSDCWAKHWFIQLCAGVHFLHKREICHNDIKPQNILVDRFFNLKLADFGLCLTNTTDRRDLYIARHSGTFGFHLDNEGLREDGKYLGQKDIFALGMVLSIMILGSDPYSTVKYPPTQPQPLEEKGGIGYDFQYSAKNEQYYFLRHTLHYANPDAVSLALRCISIDLKRRYETVADILQDPWLLPDFKKTADGQTGRRSQFVSNTIGIYNASHESATGALPPMTYAAVCENGTEPAKNNYITAKLVAAANANTPSSKCDNSSGNETYDSILKVYQAVLGRNNLFYGFMKSLFEITDESEHFKRDAERQLKTNPAKITIETKNKFFDNFLQTFDDFTHPTHQPERRVCKCFHNHPDECPIDTVGHHRLEDGIMFPVSTPTFDKHAKIYGLPSTCTSSAIIIADEMM